MGKLQNSYYWAKRE